MSDTLIARLYRSSSPYTTPAVLKCVMCEQDSLRDDTASSLTSRQSVQELHMRMRLQSAVPETGHKSPVESEVSS